MSQKDPYLKEKVVVDQYMSDGAGHLTITETLNEENESCGFTLHVEADQGCSDVVASVRIWNIAPEELLSVAHAIIAHVGNPKKP